ncbi:MAG: HlyD family secretion protein [Lentisphaerota bacterium]
MKFSRKKKWILIALIIIIISIFIFYFQGGYTSDAYIRANWAEISPRVEEFVTSVNAPTDKFVKKGDQLFQLDPYSYKLAVDKLEAEIQLAFAKKQQYTDEVKNFEEQLKGVEGQLEVDNLQVARYKFLDKQQAASDQEYQATLYQFQKDKVIRAQILEARDDSKNQVAEQEATIKQLTAQLNEAKYDLESTTVRAPFDGFIVNNYLMPGMYIKAGQSVFGIVQSQDCWIEANFKEFWIGRVKPGQTVWIMPDLYPFKVLEGKVESINRAISRTKDVDKTLPYVEPTIDWIRLQQRFTVIIKIPKVPEYMKLRMGSSARVYVFFW